jgi:hypothetical protein
LDIIDLALLALSDTSRPPNYRITKGSFDHPVGDGERCRWKLEAECLGGLKG